MKDWDQGSHTWAKFHFCLNQKIVVKPMAIKERFTQDSANQSIKFCTVLGGGSVLLEIPSFRLELKPQSLSLGHWKIPSMVQWQSSSLGNCVVHISQTGPSVFKTGLPSLLDNVTTFCYTATTFHPSNSCTSVMVRPPLSCTADGRQVNFAWKVPKPTVDGSNFILPHGHLWNLGYMPHAERIWGLETGNQPEAQPALASQTTNMA